MTIKEIAKACGVSRGTVDRVLNGRGHVKPDTREKILRTIKDEGYTKSLVGRALTIKRDAPVIGTILCSEGNPFFDDVIAGFERAEAEMKEYGVAVLPKTMRGHDAERQAALIDELTGQINALVIQPINHPMIANRLYSLMQAGVPVVTVNTDIERSCRCCYVGSDYETGGATAAALLELITQGQGHVGIITGVDELMGHRLRQHGFEQRLLECPGLPIVAYGCANDDTQLAYLQTRRMLAECPQIDAIFVVAAGAGAVCEGIIAQGREKSVRVVAYDDVPSTRAMVQRGIIRGVVCQQPAEQGYRAVRAAFDMLLSGAMNHRSSIIMENQIKIKENLISSPPEADL